MKSRIVACSEDSEDSSVEVIDQLAPSYQIVRSTYTKETLDPVITFLCVLSDVSKSLNPHYHYFGLFTIKADPSINFVEVRQ